MSIEKTFSYSGTAEQADIKSILIKRVKQPDDSIELYGYVEIKIGDSDVEIISAPLSAAMETDVESWVPGILSYVTSQFGL